MKRITTIIQFFDEYTRSALRGAGQETYDYVHEARTRLVQVDRIVEWLSEIESEIAAGKMPHEARALIQYVNDGQLLAEAFYYFSFRCREVLRMLPGLRSFECAGIRTVRNHLIEHPEKTSKILSGSFHLGFPEGPKIKPSRRENELGYEDAGLAHNLEEFSKNLQRLLSEYIRKHPAT